LGGQWKVAFLASVNVGVLTQHKETDKTISQITAFGIQPLTSGTETLKTIATRE
jgi:hypothetical protein